MGKPKKDAVEAHLSNIIIAGEYATAKRNKGSEISDFEATINMLEGVRSEKDYDWQSDISLNEFASTELTQNSLDASQYFQNREFVEVYLEDGGEESLKKADAAKECINRTLNQKHLHYYQKFMRARINNDLGGYVYARCWWDQEMRSDTRKKQVTKELDVDVYGDAIIDREVQVPARRTEEEDEAFDVVVRDRFNFDILDPRNVFTDNTYTYSLQDKDWVMVRFEKTYHQLKADKKTMGYINLDKLKDISPPNETETSKESYNKDDQHQKVEKPKNMPFDIVERCGKFWVVGEGKNLRAGLDENGEPLSSAELKETIITHAVSGSTSVLIRFQLQPYKNAKGERYKPILRGLCYIHPTKDTGLGDGQYSRELNIAIDDTFNMSNDRVSLATMPVLKGRKYALEDNTSIYFEPGHMMELENPDDVTEFKIEDNVTGALNQIGVLTGKLNQLRSIYPTTMGSLPAMSSTTATAVAGAENKSNIRANYKSLTFEYTFLIEFYGMILEMTNQFAKPETGVKLMGEKVFDFVSDMDYTYKPLSQSIEAEHSKGMKKKEYMAMLQVIGQLQNPKAPMLFNFIVAEMFKLNGAEHEKFAKFLLDENAPPEGQKGTPPNQAGSPASNQHGVAQSGQESVAREAAGA